MWYVDSLHVLGAVLGNRTVFVKTEQEVGPVLSWVPPDVASWADDSPPEAFVLAVISMILCWLEVFYSFHLPWIV